MNSLARYIRLFIIFIIQPHTMKKTTLLFFLMLMIYLPSRAQFSRVGIRAGVGMAGWSGSDDTRGLVKYSYKTGGFIGFYSARGLGTHWDIEYGFDISLKGFNFSGSYFSTGVQLGANLTNHSVYIEVPVAVRYYFGLAAPAGFFLKGGISLSYLVYNKINGSVIYNNSQIYGDPDNNASELNRFDFLLYPAVGYQFEMGLHLQLIYEFGLIDIVKNEDYLGWTNGYNRIIKLSVGFDF